jgi:hypothetical protein
MNRSARRREIRSTVHALRQIGCSCTPRVLPLPPAMERPDWGVGHYVIHETGCELGDQMATHNATGALPTIRHYPGGCSR